MRGVHGTQAFVVSGPGVTEALVRVVIASRRSAEVKETALVRRQFTGCGREALELSAGPVACVVDTPAVRGARGSLRPSSSIRTVGDFRALENSHWSETVSGRWRRPVAISDARNM